MIKLTFYGGVKTIGGNKILLEDGDTRIFLDFGMDFELYGKYFSLLLPPRKLNGLEDFLEFGLLPNLKGLYRKDALIKVGKKPEETAFDGVLLSHAHADHASYIHFLREEIPIYCSKPTYCILKALEDTSQTPFGDLINLKINFELAESKSKKKDANPLKRLKNNKFERDINCFDYNKKFKIGSLDVLPIAIDHSLPGTTGFIIYTSSGPVVYTGDFRFHGYRGKQTHNFVEKCIKEKPAAVICEGTRVKETQNRTEYMVKRESETVLSKTKNLLVFNSPIRDIDRLKTFDEIAIENNRKLVVSLRHAYLLDLLCDVDENVPKLDGKNVLVYAQRRDWGVYKDKRYPKYIQKQDYLKWEREFVFSKRSIDFETIKKNQNEYVFYCNFFQLKDLIDIRPKKGSSYIRSICEPFSEEMRIDDEKLKRWLKHFGMPMHQIHCSGHANGAQIKKMISNINPKFLFPVHTEYPGMLRGCAKDTSIRIVKYGKSYRI